MSSFASVISLQSTSFCILRPANSRREGALGKRGFARAISHQQALGWPAKKGGPVKRRMASDGICGSKVIASKTQVVIAQ